MGTAFYFFVGIHLTPISGYTFLEKYGVRLLPTFKLTYPYLGSFICTMYISSAQASKLLGISPRRMRTLLLEGRVQGAYKVGRNWIIPLRDGRPTVRPGTRGCKSRWATMERKPREEDYKVVKVLQKEIRYNAEKETTNPVISVTKSGEKAHHVHEIYVHGPVRLCYSLEPRQDKGNAKVWLETHFPIELFITDFANNRRIATGFV